MRFEDLEVWKRSARLSADVYRGMQSVRDFGFRDQLTRAELSVPSKPQNGVVEAVPRHTEIKVAERLGIETYGDSTEVEVL